MKTAPVVFPFDQFGSAGTGAGALLMGDALREILEDIRAEEKPIRGKCFVDEVENPVEFSFDTLVDVTNWRSSAEEILRETIDAQQSPLWLAGNHLCVLPIYEMFARDALIIQFDAHLDVYNLSDSVSDLSHGNFMMHVNSQLPKVINIGARDLFLPKKHVENYFEQVWTIEDYHTRSQQMLKSISARIKKAKKVWIDIDCDVFDPADFPAVQHAVPFGLRTGEMLHLLSTIWTDKIVGISLSEFDPGRDQHDQSLRVLVWLMEWFLLKRYEQ